MSSDATSFIIKIETGKNCCLQLPKTLKYTFLENENENYLKLSLVYSYSSQYLAQFLHTIRETKTIHLGPNFLLWAQNSGKNLKVDIYLYQKQDDYILLLLCSDIFLHKAQKDHKIWEPKQLRKMFLHRL